METHLTISVIIPTYNRQSWLCETLESLAQQTWPADRFEVIVVDDGSEDGTAEIVEQSFPFPLRYFWQSNQGDAAARNTGVQQSQADILVFLDDDILIAPNYLASLAREHVTSDKCIVVGTEHLWLEQANPLQHSPVASTESDTRRVTEIPFAEVCSNNMSLWRKAYFSIGMMQGLGFSGSSIWCDVDFSYRAYQQGFAFYRTSEAICWHRDYVASSLENQKKRMQEAAYRAVALFRKYPELLPHIPMFDDKTPITWGQDPLPLVTRKIARHVASSRPMLWSLEQLATILAGSHLSSHLYQLLHRWIIGGHIFRGYREGLRSLFPGGKRVSL
jgi:glycosyltransferase involved in cell wall biosynthesis